MSNFNDLLTLTQTAITDLDLTWPATSALIPVEIASQPLNRAEVEPALPTVWITPAIQPETVEEGATGNYKDVTYRLELAIVAPGNASFETNLPTYLDIRERCRKALQRAYFPAVSGFWGVRLTPKEVLTRDLQRDNYDLSILGIEYMVLESAT